MNVSNGSIANTTTTLTTADDDHLSSSPPPLADTVHTSSTNDTVANAANASSSSSPDRRSDVDEQPIIISPEFLPLVVQMVESLNPRRVKVYELRGEVWVDLGTGFCQGLIENVELILWIWLIVEYCLFKSYQRGNADDRVVEL
jgi:hypothetical protein